MSYPTQVTVGSLLEFLNSQLAKGNVDAETPIYIEVYSLTPEEERLKAKQCSMTPEEQEAQGLDYHIPDDSPDEMCFLTMGSGKPVQTAEPERKVGITILLPFPSISKSKSSPFELVVKALHHQKMAEFC